MNPSDNPNVLVSVVIPVKNGASTIGQCLEALYAQTLARQMEVILIDSGSTDDTAAIAARFPVRVITIPAETFNHGLTRNLGTENTKGGLVYFTVQDARLSAVDALERMATHFRDAAVMGVCGRQAIPWEKDKNPVQWYRPVSQPEITRYQFTGSNGFIALPPSRQAQLSAWDNVNAMYRRSALEQLPFIRTDFAEDMYWAKSALEKGWAIIHDPAAFTWHYHHRNFSYSFRSTFILYYSVYRYFKILPGYPPLFTSLKDMLLILWREHRVGFGEKFYWFRHSVADFWGKTYATLIFRRIARSGDDNRIRSAYENYCGQVPLGRLKGQ
jgi:rhamnosyltransferase